MTRQAREYQIIQSIFLSLLSLLPALYTIRWKSQVIRQKIQSLTPAPNVVSSSAHLVPLEIVGFSLAFVPRILYFWLERTLLM
jgi:uncharacterized membrane protein